MIQYLKNIKNKLQQQEMSVMIGAGFSKNVNNQLFPTWSQLLADMINQMHGERFKEDHDSLPKKKQPTLSDYLQKRREQYINETGLLEVASRFMEFNGYREALDAYIERHTPWIDERDGVQYLQYYQTNSTGQSELAEVALSETDMQAHRKLVKLPWNNIYTTNYDNLLEKSVDTTVEVGIQLKSPN